MSLDPELNRLPRVPATGGNGVSHKRAGVPSEVLDNDRRGFLIKLGAVTTAFVVSVFGIARRAEAGNCQPAECYCQLCKASEDSCLDDCGNIPGCIWSWGECYECMDPFGPGACGSWPFECSWCSHVYCSYNGYDCT